jgi:sulfite oxidase
MQYKKITGILTVSKVDSAGNIQPEHPIWNYRGVMNNSWRTFEPNKIEQSNM